MSKLPILNFHPSVQFIGEQFTHRLLQVSFFPSLFFILSKLYISDQSSPSLLNHFLKAEVRSWRMPYAAWVGPKLLLNEN
jgi:hypothetical protein